MLCVRPSLHTRAAKRTSADCVIAVTANLAGGSRMVTFDEAAARDLGMELLA